MQRLPDAQTLDRIAYRTTIFAFPIFGFGVIFGAIWAEEAWGRHGAGIPRRRSPSSRGGLRGLPARVHRRLDGQKGRVDQRRRFVAMVFNLFFINLVTVGLHSYAGVS